MKCQAPVYLFALGALVAYGAETGAPGKTTVQAESRIVFPGAMINGKPMRLALDTGSTTAIIFEEAVKRLGLKTMSSVVVASAKMPAGKTLGTSEGMQLSLSGKTYTVSMPILTVGEVGSHQDVDALIGWQEVRDKILVFDPDKKAVRSVASVPPETAGWLKLKIHPGSVLLLEMPLPEGVTGVIMVDTGTFGGVTFSPDRWQAWRKAHPQAAVTRIPYIMPGVGGRFRETAMADEVTLGNLRLNNLTVTEANPSEMAVGSNLIASLGLEVLARMDLVVDGPGGYAYVHPRPATFAPPTEKEGTDWKIEGDMPLSFVPIKLIN